MDLETKIKFFIPKFYHLLLQINGKLYYRKGEGVAWERGRGGGDTDADLKKEQQEEESGRGWGTRGISIFKNTSLSHVIFQVWNWLVYCKKHLVNTIFIFNN